jgi:2-dehydro-3-deoxyphosphogluconate aldolase/(4S)-4-hydroxy-2-oxoglutarate aldolase
LSIVAHILEHGLIAVIDAPIEDAIVEWGIAVSQGGINVLGVPVTLANVTEVVSELDDEGDLIVGISGVIEPSQVAVAVAAGAELVITPVNDPEIIEAAKSRGLVVIAGALTPNEIQIARRAGADLISVHPVGAIGGGERYFESIRRTFPEVPLLVSGNIDVENAPAFLELGAAAAMVDRNVFPEEADPAASQIITMRAVALTEVCADALGTPARISFTDIKSDLPPPPDSGIAQLFDDDLVEGEREGSQPLLDEASFESVALDESDMITLDPEE